MEIIKNINLEIVKNLKESKLDESFGRNEKEKEFIEFWNKTKNKNDLLSEELDFCKLAYEYESLMKSIQRDLIFISCSIKFIKDDFDQFIKRKSKLIEDEYNNLMKSKQEDSIKQKNDAENLRMSELCDGILSHEEVNLNHFMRIFTPYESENTTKLFNNYINIVNEFYSYYFIKLEQLVSFCGFDILNLDINEKRYLPEKINFVNENELFKNKFEASSFKKLLKIWNYLKHQDKKLEKDVSGMYDKKYILDSIKLLNEKYCYVYKLFNFEKVLGDIQNFIDDVDGIINPLGISYF